MAVKKPVIIIGTGRSGSTLLYEMMAEHPNAAWTSKCCQYFPSRPAVNKLFLNLIDWPLLGSLLKKKVHPREYYQFWDYWHKGFSTVCRDMRVDDVTQSAHRLNAVYEKMLTAKRNRLMLKITGWPRIGFLREIFPDAKFIHILRDGRSVSSSMLSQTWWWGWQGPENWRWGQLTEDQRQLWQQYDKSFIVLAAIEWIILMDSFDKASAGLSPDIYRTIKYEDLCKDVPGVMREITEFCELDWNDQFANRLNRYAIKSANEKWKTELNTKQQDDLQAVLNEYLHRYGYQ